MVDRVMETRAVALRWHEDFTEFSPFDVIDNLKSMGHFFRGIICSEFGKERHPHHFHALVVFDEDIASTITEFRNMTGDPMAYAKFYNPLDPRDTLEAFIENWTRYITKDNDWTDF